MFKDCIDCERYEGCHANCPTYLRDRKRLDEAKAKQRSDNDYIGYCVSAIGIMKRKKGNLVAGSQNVRRRLNV